jgi:hypothetical protein
VYPLRAYGVWHCDGFVPRMSRAPNSTPGQELPPLPAQAVAMSTHRAWPREVGAGDREPGLLNRRYDLVLYIHRVGVDGFLSSDSLNPGQQTAVIVLVGLESESTLLPAIVPGDADKMFLRF